MQSRLGRSHALGVLLALFAFWSVPSRAAEDDWTASLRQQQELSAFCTNSPSCGTSCFAIDPPRVCGYPSGSDPIWVPSAGTQGQVFEGFFSFCNVSQFKVELCTEGPGSFCSLVHEGSTPGPPGSPWTVPACHPTGSSRVVVSGTQRNRLLVPQF